MPRLPRLTAPEAECVPFHRGKILHPKIAREVLSATGGI
jgi:hypothetical protein